MASIPFKIKQTIECKVNPFVVKIDTRIEAHPFRTKDFTRDNPFVNEIIQTGIRII